MNELITGWKIRNGDSMRDILIEADVDSETVEINWIDRAENEAGIALALDTVAIDAFIEILTIIKERLQC